MAPRQLGALATGIPVTLASNLVIAALVAFILEHDGTGREAVWWLLGVFVFAFGRFWITRSLLARVPHTISARKALRVLSGLSFCSGLTWVPVPIVLCDIDSAPHASYLVFIMLGMATGSITQSLCYKWAGISFAVPVFAATLYGLVSTGGAISVTISAIVAIYAGMLLRTAFLGERGFVEMQTTALRATDLADSLAAANREIRDANIALERLANTDALTGLGNRLWFNGALDRATDDERGVALILVDLDAFKAINDSRGHGFGDAVLRHVAECLGAVCDARSAPARLGGDEFAVLVSGEEADAHAVGIALRLVEDFSHPRTIAGLTLSLGLSIGIAAGAGKDGELLCSEADAALYRAKSVGGAAMRVFDLAVDRETLRRHIRAAKTPAARPQVRAASAVARIATAGS